MNDKFVVESGIELWGMKGRGRTEKYPWAQMEVGDSFFVAWGNPASFTAYWQAGIRHGMKFAKRSVDGGVRIWRVA